LFETTGPSSPVRTAYVSVRLTAQSSYTEQFRLCSLLYLLLRYSLL